MSQPVILRFLGDTTDLEAAFKRAAAGSGVFEGLVKKMDAVGAASVRAGRSLTRAITIPVVAAGAGAVTLALKFDQAMNRIGALTDVGAKGVAGLSKEVLDLAKTVPIGPVKLAEGLYYLESAGLSSKVAMDALKASAKGSAAGLGDFAKLSDVVSGVLKGWPDIVGGATGAVDVLIKTVKEGKLEPEALALELGKVLAPASAVGVKFNEVGAALAAMSNKNLNAEASTTALRQIFVELQKPTKAAAVAMTAAGTSADEVRKTLKEKGLLSALQLLNKGVGDNSEQWFKLFPNVRAATGVMALMGKNSKDTEAIFKSFGVTTGQLSAAFDQMQKDPMTRLKLAWNKIQVAAIQVGQILIPIVEKVAAKVSELVDKFSSLDRKTQETILKFLALGAAVGPALYTFGKLVLAFTTLAKNPILGFLILLGAALTTAYTNSKPFRDTVNGIGEKLKDWGLNSLVPKLHDFAEGVKKVANSPEAAKVLKAVGEDIKLIGGMIQPAVDGIKALWGKFESTDKVQAARDALKTISDVLTNPAFQIALGAAAGAVGGWLLYATAVKGAAIAMGILDGAMALFDALAAANPVGLIVIGIAALAGAVYVAYQKFGPFRSALNQTWEVIKDLGGAVKQFGLWWWQAFNLAVDAVEWLLKSVYKFAKNAEHYTSFEFLSKGIRAFFNALPGWASSAWSYVLGTTQQKWSQVLSAVGSAFSSIGQWFGRIPGLASTAWNYVVTTSKQKWAEVKNGAVNFFKSAGTWLLQAGKDLVIGFAHGITNAAGAVTDAAKGLGSSALNAVKNVLSIMSPSREMAKLGMFAGQGFAKGLSDSTLGVTKVATDQMKKLLATYQSKTKSLSSAQRKLKNDNSLVKTANLNLAEDLHRKKVNPLEIRKDKEAIARAKARVAGDQKTIAADKAAVAAAKAAYAAEVRYQTALNARRKAGAAMLSQAQAMVADYSKKTAVEFSSPMAKAADNMAKALTSQFADRDGALPDAVNKTVDSLKGMADDINSAFEGMLSTLKGQTSLTSKFTDVASTSDMAGYLAGKVDDLKAFNVDLRYLAKRGVPKSLLTEFLGAGLSALPVVESLANSGDSDFNAILALQSQVDKLSGGAAQLNEDLRFGTLSGAGDGPYRRAPRPAAPPATTTDTTPAVVVNVETGADPVAIGQEVAWAVKGVG